MKFSKKLISVTALALCVALCTTLVGAAAFTDVPAGSDCAAAVEALAARGIVKGTGAGFLPNRTLTVRELVTFLGRAAAVKVDNSTGDGWSSGYIAWAKAKGLPVGDPSAELTKAEIDLVLQGFCAACGIPAVTVNGATRGDFAVALAKICGDEVKATYTSVTTAEDWGPAVSKLILDLGVELAAASVTADKFEVASVRTVPGFDFITFSPTAPAPVTVSRTVTAAYVCDAKGVKAAAGTHVALELKIHPDATEGSPFNYDFITGHNSFIPISHTVTLTAPLASAKGALVTMAPVTGEPAANVTPLADDFTEATYTYTYGEGDAAISLGYGYWSPKANAAKGSTPLIVWLHGAGEGAGGMAANGADAAFDPTISIIGNRVVNLISDDVQKCFGATGAAVLAPQCPTMWMNDGSGGYRDPAGTDGRSYYTDALKGLLDTWLAAHPEIDTKRIYVGGCSNGGYMTVNMIIEYPDFFAAAWPVCEAYSANWLTDEMVAKIKDIPIWLTAAKNDTTVSIFEGEGDGYTAPFTLSVDENGNNIPKKDYSNDLYDRLTAAGAKDAHYSLFEDVHDTTGLYNGLDGKPYQYMGHWSWIYALKNECVDTIGGKQVTIFEWLAQQSK